MNGKALNPLFRMAVVAGVVSVVRMHISRGDDFDVRIKSEDHANALADEVVVIGEQDGDAGHKTSRGSGKYWECRRALGPGEW